MDVLIKAAVDGGFMIFIALIGYLVKVVTGYLKKEGLLAELENKRQYADIVVKATQQLFQEADGPEKFERAKDNLIIYLQKHKIPIDEDELNELIESAVKAMKEGIKEGAA